MSNTTAELAEFAKNLWNNYIKPNAKEEFNGTLTFYRAKVTANTHDGYLTVQQPYDTDVTVRCTAPLNDAQVGDVVTVVCFGRDIPNNQIAFLLGSNTNLENYIAEYGCTVEQTGDVINFNDPYGDLPLCSLKTNYEPIQDLSNGDPSPTNICPITGWTGINIYVSATQDLADATTYTVLWADAGYYGELNVTTGVLTRKGRVWTLDGTESWTTAGSGTTMYYYAAKTRPSHGVISNSTPYKMCSHYTPVGTSSSAQGFMVVNQSSATTRIGIRPDLTAYPSSADFKTYVAQQYANDTPIVVVYMLDESLWTTEQLSSTEIQTLLGANNIWTNTNGVTTASYIVGHNGLMSVNDKYKLDHIEKYTSEGTVTSVTIEATSPIAVNTTDPITTVGVRTISHENSGATAGTYGDSSAQTPTFGGTFKVPTITVDAKGHTTAASAHNVTIPNATATESVAGLMSATDKTKLDGIDPSTYAKYGDAISGTGTAASNTTGIGVSTTVPATTSITGVSGSTTASHVDSGSNGTAPSLGTAFSVPNVTGVGTLPTATYDSTNQKVTFSAGTLPTLGTAFSIPNVTSVGTASTWAFSSVTVPIAGTAKYVPARSSSGNITASSTVADTGHTHTVSVTGTIDTP